MMLGKTLIYIFIIVVYNIITNADLDYGEFILTVTKVEQCRGPKRKNCCLIDIHMENAVNMIYKIQVLENVVPNKGKIIAMANGMPLVRLQMKKPCDHLFLGPLFKTIMNVSSNCVFKKGSYQFILNIEDVAQKYYGGSFLYGNMTFKSVFYSDQCNFSCTVVEVEIAPKNKTFV